MFEIVKQHFCFEGTPGVGKSTLCQQLEEKTGLEWLQVGKIAEENQCFNGYDEDYNCPILDEEKARVNLFKLGYSFNFTRFVYRVLQFLVVDMLLNFLSIYQKNLRFYIIL